ncbi:MAG: hypothetical protein FJZ09_06000 [Candidatus Omnitrophica bacterium]|nr:hypothetical protein [Candidatus Omnitrophota bacterium]
MRKSSKVMFEVDRSGRFSCLRKTVDGEFKVNKNNLLFYRLKKPIPANSPSQLKLTGKWSLNKEHNLIFSLDKENNLVSGGKFTLEGEIIDVKANELAFCLRTKDSRGMSHLSLLRLNGRWQADKYNCLNFMVSRESEEPDALTFTGSWEVNKRNELIYTYTKAWLKKKEKLTRTLTFKGYWDIREKCRLSYVLSKESDSGFDFRVSIGKPAKRGMEYVAGIGITPKRKRISLSGSWRLNPRLGLTFEMPCEEGRVRAIIFGAECRLAKGADLEFKLRNELDRDLGISLRLSKAVLGDSGRAFLETLKERGNISIFAGAGVRW